MTDITPGMERALQKQSICIGAFMGKGDRPGTSRSFGSCIAVRHLGEIRIITAAHTLEGAVEDHRTCMIRFGDKAFALNQVPFRFNRDLDIGISIAGHVADITRHFEALPNVYDIPNTTQILNSLPLRGVSNRVGLLGFPASKGKVALHYPSTITLSNIITEEVAPPDGSPIHIIAYSYNWRRPGGFNPLGMSGGGAFTLIPAAGEDQWDTLLRGVLIAHDEGSRILASELAYFDCW